MLTRQDRLIAEAPNLKELLDNIEAVFRHEGDYSNDGVLNDVRFLVDDYRIIRARIEGEEIIQDF